MLQAYLYDIGDDIDISFYSHATLLSFVRQGSCRACVYRQVVTLRIE